MAVVYIANTIPSFRLGIPWALNAILKKIRKGLTREQQVHI